MGLGNAMSQGWDGVDKVDKQQQEEEQKREERRKGGGGGGGGGYQRPVFRVRLKPGEVRKYLMLSDSTNIWEHRFPTVDAKTGRTKFDNFEPCRREQDLEINTRECPIDERWGDKNRPYYVGLFTALSLTPFWSQKGYEWLFNRYILPARLGSAAKPGMLKRLKVLAERNNNTMVGCVIECRRQAKKCEVIGDSIDTIEVIPKDKIVEWLRPQIAEFVARVNQSIDRPEAQLTVEKVLERDPPRGFNFARLIKSQLRTNEQLWSMIGPPKDGSKPQGQPQGQEQSSQAQGQGQGQPPARRQEQRSQSSQSSHGGGGGYDGDGPPPHTDDDQFGGGYRGRRAEQSEPSKNGGSAPKRSSQGARLDDDIPF